MITQGKKVKFHYQLKVKDKIVEDSHLGNPLEYVHGKDNIISGLQKGLEGKKAGESCTIRVAPEDGYGKRDPRALVEVERDRVPKEALEVGAILSAKNQEGETHQGVVKNIRSEYVLIDFNHPLAGEVLTFDVEVLKVSLDV